MNRSLIICRLRWPALLLLTGIIALCHQFGVMSWGHAWPLYLILLGVLALAERAALASDPGANLPPGSPYGAAPYGAAPYAPPAAYPGYPYPPPPAAPAEPVPAAPASTGIVPRYTEIVPASEFRSTESAEEERRRADFRQESQHNREEETR